MRFFIMFLMVFFCFYSCKKEKSLTVDISSINGSFNLSRFDVDFYTAKHKDLLKLKAKYPYFFPESMPDSISIAKMKNKDEQELFSETQKIYKDFTDQKIKLSSLFKHIRYYNPKFKPPRVVTILSNIDYESRVIHADSLLLISLDVFLGKEHAFYNDYPKYIKQNNSKEHLIVDVAKVFIEWKLQPKVNRSFISKMIYEGKKMYLLDLYLPEVKDVIKFGTTDDKFNWALSNEEQIWSYFIQNELLFSTDTKLNSRFLETAPFSKFYMKQDDLSPGKIGVWVGWQIVRSFMKHNDVSLQELIKINETDLFSKSKYKPRK